MATVTVAASYAETFELPIPDKNAQIPRRGARHPRRGAQAPLCPPRSAAPGEITNSQCIGVNNEQGEHCCSPCSISTLLARPIQISNQCSC